MCGTLKPPMTEFAIQLAIRFVIFGLVLVIALRKRDDVKVQPKWAVPLVALAIALFNALLYPVLAPVLKLAALGFGSVLVPLGLNGVVLALMNRYLRFFELEGLKPLLVLATWLTGAHAALYLAFQWIW